MIPNPERAIVRFIFGWILRGLALLLAASLIATGLHVPFDPVFWLLVLVVVVPRVRRHRWQ